jgi:hypothetical protein
VNTEGSYQCMCPPGYKQYSHRYIFVVLPVQHECVNTEGSYQCMCPPGYKQYGDRCIDVDECVEQQVSNLMILAYYFCHSC